MASKELPVSKALIYCALCKSKLKKSEKNLFCPKCKNKFKFPLDQSPDEVEKQFQKKMKYCYNCSEKLFVDDDSVVCIDGCELIDISLETPEAEEPQETMDEKSISKQKEDKEGETSKTKDGEIRDPPLSSIQNEDDTSGNQDSPPLNDIQQQKNKDETSKSKDSPTLSSMKNEDETSENKDDEMQDPPVSSKDEKITNETKKPDLSVNAKQQHKTEQDSSKDALRKDLQDTTTEEETFYDAPNKPVQHQHTDITPSSETSQQDSTNSKDQPPLEKNPPKDHPLQPDVKQNGLRPTDDSHIRSNGDVITNQPKTERTFSYDDPPDFEVIESVITEISRKWWMIGEKLGLKRNELSALQKQPNDKSLRDVLERWIETHRKPYTWDTFLVALRSSDVDMKEVADDIESMLFGYDNIQKGEEEEEEVEEDYQEHLEDNRLDPNIPVNQFIFNRGKDDRHKLCPSNILVKDCMTIRMHTILDLKAWNLKPQDVKRLSTISHMIGIGNRSFCKFKRIDESEDYIIFQSLVPIPNNFIVKWRNRVFFRYKYVIRVGKERIVEDLGISNHEWRVIEITKQIREATSPTDHFDTVVLPSAAFERRTFRGLFKDTKKEVIYMGTYQSLKVYLSFGVKIGWLTMKTHDFTIEAKNKATCLSSVFKNLKQQHYKLPRTDEPGILEIDATLENELLALFSSLLDSREGLQKFLTGMIIAEFTCQCSLFSLDCFWENVEMTKSILKCFAIPVNEFQRFCQLMKKLDHEFMKNTLEVIVKILCDTVIDDSVLHHEWMEVLPFLHTIRSNDFSPEKPVTLPNDATAVRRIMFCGLKMDKFISRITKESK